MKFAASLVAASATLLCFVCLSWVVLEHHVDSYTWNFKKLSSESAFTEADWEATDIVATVATPALHSAEKALSRLHLGFMSDPAKPPACIDMIASVRSCTCWWMLQLFTTCVNSVFPVD
eukprot:SAG31_NODE_2751_length_5144_cov_2.392666_2_plen_119_part_00